MTKEEFLKLPDPDKLKVMKKVKNYLAHNFQHQEIVEIERINTRGQYPRITVWIRGVDAENWSKFTDYYHYKEKYDLIFGEFVWVETD